MERCWGKTLEHWGLSRASQRRLTAIYLPSVFINALADTNADSRARNKPPPMLSWRHIWQRTNFVFFTQPLELLHVRTTLSSHRSQFRIRPWRASSTPKAAAMLIKRDLFYTLQLLKCSTVSANTRPARCHVHSRSVSPDECHSEISVLLRHILRAQWRKRSRIRSRSCV